MSHKLILCYEKHLPSFSLVVHFLRALFFWPLLFYSNTFSIVYSTCPRAFEFTSWLLLFKLIANKRASTVYIRQAASWPRACLSSLHRHQPQSQPLPLIPTHAMQKFN